MKLKKLFKGVPDVVIKGNKEAEVTGVCSNSKRIAPGNLFIAKKGFKTDGACYIDDAIAAGAIAVLTDMYDPTLKGVTQVIHPHIKEIEGSVASQFHGHPSADLFMVGITGTDGKTTTSYLARHLLESLRIKCGLIGTIEHIIGDYHYDPTHTTPDVTTNHKMLHEMVIQGCKAGVMEVTSHALDQGRVKCIDFDVGVFTNISSEHLDYHGTIENYVAAKARLFRSLPEGGCAIVNADDLHTPTILERCKARVISYGMENSADLMATEVKLHGTYTTFTLNYKGETIPCRTPLVGRFNVYNTLAAVGIALAREFPLKKIAEKLEHFPSVPGRLQTIANPLGLRIYVDYAHTDDALRKVLTTLRETAEGSIITVFGCGGDRDRTKRPRMARVAEELSTKCILTSDNPRSEDPLKICDEAAIGFVNPQKIEPDRYAAIELAISSAKPNDVILIAGKGHEKFQVFAHRTVEFDDCLVAQEICRKIHGGRG